MGFVFRSSRKGDCSLPQVLKQEIRQSYYRPEVGRAINFLPGRPADVRTGWQLQNLAFIMITVPRHLYAFVHWLSTIAICPLVLVAIDCVVRGGFRRPDSELLALYLLFGGIFSIPAAILYIYFVSLVQKYISNLVVLKVVGNLFVILTIIVTLLIIDGSMVLNLIFAYSLATVLASVLIRVKD